MKKSFYCNRVFIEKILNIRKGKQSCVFVSVTLFQMMSQNLRGEMSADLAGAKLCLTDSRFIQVIAKSLSISCKEVRAPAAHT